MQSVSRKNLRLMECLSTAIVKANAGVTVGGYLKPLPKFINAKICLFDVPLRAVYNVQFLRVYEV